MDKNIIPDIAKMLGVEIGEKFEIGEYHDTYMFSNDKLLSLDTNAKDTYMLKEPTQCVFENICNGTYPIKKLLFKPKYGEPFCYIRTNGGVACDAFGYDIFSASMYLIGNCFRTEEEASAHKDEIMAKFQEVL